MSFFISAVLLILVSNLVCLRRLAQHRADRLERATLLVSAPSYLLSAIIWLNWHNFESGAGWLLFPLTLLCIPVAALMSIVWLVRQF